MMKPSDLARRSPFVALAAAALALVFSLSACGGGGGGGGGSVPPPIPVEPPPPVTPVLPPTADLPGVNIEILAVTKTTGSGNPLPGDTLEVEFTIERDDGTPIPPAEMNTLRLYVSGPTFNYQIVIPRQDDGRARSVETPTGSWIYTFGLAIPFVYDVPPNDSPTYGLADGELSGEPLVSATYTVGMEGYKIYNVEGVDYRDADNATKDFLLGTATTLEARDVVRTENCQRCHVEIRAHGNARKDVQNCILCHVSGAEDRNVPAVAGGTPGASIDFRVMIHKIHNGEHLPSVNGVATNPDGSRNYSATPVPYQLVGNGNSINDFSHVPFPVWPNLTFPMPRDYGFSTLTSPQQAQEDMLRTGVTRCDKCHGDPDGTGPLTAPTQGTHAYTHSTRGACGSCHDDIDWARPYTSNLMQMPQQTDDSSCNFCHNQPGSLNPQSAHVHPINNPSLNPGIHFVIQGVAEGGTNNGDGKIQAGEKVQVTFDMHDDAGNPVTPAGWASMSPSGSVNVAIAGPTTNRQLLVSTGLPLAFVTGSAPYTIRVPEVVILDYVGDSTGVLDTFTGSRSPFWNVSGGTTTVFARTASGSSATAATAVRLAQNYVDLVPGFNTDPMTGGFAKDAYVVIDDNVPGKEEYLRIQWVDGNRIWFGQSGSTSYQPATRVSHAAGAAVQVVTLTTKTAGSQYTVNAPAGQITEVAEFGAGNAVLVTYTTDFVMPATYPVPLNDTPDQGQNWGEWASLGLQSGTYTVGFWASRQFPFAAFGETQNYRNTSVNDEAQANFLVGSATVIQPETIISSKDNCNACHDTIYAHGGGREGYNTCILCHGTAGSEDRPRYVAPGAPPTTEVGIDFRSMLHKIHMGEELTQAATWTVVGFGSGSYPNNFSLNSYGEVVFPAMPDGVKNCEKCHGVGNTAWQVPTPRNHPSQTTPTGSWRVVCGSCHDDPAVEAHIQSQTSPAGVESCSICHGPGEAVDVALKHKIR